MLRRKTLNQIHATHRDRIASRPRIAAAIMLCAIPFFGGFFGGATLAADAKHADASHADHDAGHGDHGHLPEIGHNLPAGTTQKAFESPAWFQTDLAVWSFVVFLGLLGLLTKFAWKPIMDGLDKREQGIADTIAATQAANVGWRRPPTRSVACSKRPAAMPM